MKPRQILAPALLLLPFAWPAAAQQTPLSRWLGNTTEPAPLWSTAANWDPSGVPGMGNDVAISGALAQVPPGLPFAGPAFDASAVVANLYMAQGGGLGSGINFLPDFFDKNLTVTGSTSFNSGGGTIAAASGCTFSLGTLYNQDNGILRNPAGFVNFADHRSPSIAAVIQWRGANVIRNEGAIARAGNLAFFRNQDTGADALANFRDNAGSFATAGGTFTTGGAFTNSGVLQIFGFAPGLSRMVIGGNFVNFDPANGSLATGILIQLDGLNGCRAELAFPGADIRALSAGSRLNLNGDAAILDSVSGANGLRHLGEIGGDLSIANALGLTPTGGPLLHTGGNLEVRTNGFLTVTGDLQQYQSATAHVHGANGAPARLTITGNTTALGSFILGDEDGASPDNAVLLTSTFDGSASVQGSGTIDGSMIRFRGNVTPGSAFPVIAPFKATAAARAGAPEAEGKAYRVMRPGGRFETYVPRALGARPGAADGGATVVPGRLLLKGPVTFGADAVTTIGIAPEGPCVIEQRGAGGVVLDGALTVIVPDGFVPVSSAQYIVVEASSLFGQFTNALQHGRVFTDKGTFVISYVHGAGFGRVVLSDYEPTAPPQPAAPVTTFTGLGEFNEDWSDAENWTADIPGAPRLFAEIPGNFDTAAFADFTALDTLTIRAGASHQLVNSTRLEFGVVRLEANPINGATLFSNGDGVLAVNRLLATNASGAENIGSYIYLPPGLHLRQAGAIPARMLVSKTNHGTLQVATDLQPYTGSTLFLQAGDVALLSVTGVISEVMPSPPVTDGGAAVVVTGAGRIAISGANTYTGGTVVRDSLSFGLGGNVSAGGLILDHPAGSPTGPGPVRLITSFGPDAFTDNRGVLSGIGLIAGDLSVEGGWVFPGNTGVSPTGTLTLGGSLTFTDGVGTAGSLRSNLFINLDPQNPDPLQRFDRLLLTSATAQVRLLSGDLSVFLSSPPSPGQSFRIIDAPNAGNTVTGSFNGLPPGASVSAFYGGLFFAFTTTYGANYVQLAHTSPPPVSYLYVRAFWFNVNQVYDPAISGPTADPYGRGVSNLMAYALGEDPRTLRFDRLPRASTRTVSGTPYPVIEIRRAIPLRPDLQYFVAESTNLSTGFGTPFDIDAPADAARIVSRSDNADGTETIVIRASAPISASADRFLRFSVNSTP